jgi:hypothetical protein
MAHIRRIPGFTGKEARTGICYVTGRPPSKTPDQTRREDIIDLDTWIEGEGNLEITLDTAREIAGLIGWIDETTANDLTSRLNEKIAEVRELTDRLRDKDLALQVLAQGVVDSVQAKAS